MHFLEKEEKEEMCYSIANKRFENGFLQSCLSAFTNSSMFKVKGRSFHGFMVSKIISFVLEAYFFGSIFEINYNYYYCVVIPHTFSTLVTCFSSYLFMKYSPVHFGNAES